MKSQGGIRVAFAALVIPAPQGVDLHVTIARRYDVTEADIRAMQHDLERLIRPHLPIQLEFGNFCHLGEKGTFPAYKMHVHDSAIRTILQRYHDQYYKEAPGKGMYPKLKFHVTVDTPQKRDFLEEIMRTGERFIIIRDTIFRTMTKGAEPVIEDNIWQCPDCDTRNPLDQKVCGSQYCDQWRPMQAMPQREGDWACASCGYNNFASRASCAKCNMKRHLALHVPQYPFNPYIQPPSAPPAPPTPMPFLLQNEHGAVPQPAAAARRSDWFCHKCQFKIYGHKAQCGKCGSQRPN